MVVSSREFANYFRLQGRCYVSDERLFFNASGGGFSGTFRGKTLTLTVYSDYEMRWRNAYVSVILDDKPQRVRLPKGEKEITFCVGEGTHVFEIVKLTESANNSFGVRSVFTDGEFLPKNAGKGIKIDFIGDSITTGFGVLAKEMYGEYKTKEQDFTKAFPYIVSKALDADYHVVAAGGWPIYKSKYADYAIPDYYENVDLLRNREKYDFSSFTPDVCVVTLGTNDFSFLADLPAERLPAERAEVKKKFIVFLHRLLSLYPTAHFFLLYGFFDYPDLGVLTKEVAAEIDDPRITTVETECAARYGDLHAGHPGMRTHIVAARRLLTAMDRVIMNKEKPLA